MTGVALKGLAGRKIRALLTALAVVIGVAMVAGTFVLTDTMQKSFDGLFSASLDETDAVVAGKEIVAGSTNGSGVTVPAGLVEQIRALPEVEAAGGTVAPQEINGADIIGADGKAVAKESLGMSYDAENPRFSPLRLKTGDWPQGAGEVVIDAGTAARQDLAAGEDVVVATGGERATYEITGTAGYGDVDSLGFASIAVWDVPTAQAVLDREGRYDTVSIAARAGTSPDELVAAVAPLVRGQLEVKDSAQQAEDDAAKVDKGMTMIRLFLLGFGVIALLVGAFVIFNTLSITVAQRTREFATLRTLGASRRQVLRSVVLEGLVIGLVASVLGILAGFALSKGMIALFSLLGVDLPDAPTVVAPRTIVVSLLLGTGITLLASVLPARRATRVPPIAAVREGAILPRAGVGSSRAVAAAIAAGVRILGWPARRAGVAGELAGANAVRNPGRTAATAAALTIGLCLVTVVAVLGAGLKATMVNAVSDQVRADHVIDGKQGLSFRAAEGDALAGTPGVTAASHVRSDTALVDGEEGAVSGVNPASIGRFYRFAWSSGSSGAALDRLGADGALVTEDYAEAHDVGVGGRLSLTTPSGERRTLVVRGVHDPPRAKPLLGPVTMTQAGFDDAFGVSKNSFTFLDGDGGTGAALAAAAKDLGDATYHSGADFPEDATKSMSTMLAMLYVLLGFSVVVSLFGMVNTMVLSVFERTREIGMLRALGMTRRQARRMIRQESVITALIGAVVGLGLGVVLAALATQAMSGYDVAFSLPVAPLVAFTLVAVAAGIAAAVMPARRASRLNVLGALAYE